MAFDHKNKVCFKKKKKHHSSAHYTASSGPTNPTLLHGHLVLGRRPRPAPASPPAPWRPAQAELNCLSGRIPPCHLRRVMARSGSG
uniref:Sialidase n=1 Tax=Trypanosoma rangeli TaxID=5698 RepID=Q27065_TRYRA|nr:sialidase [Trypanosoma rangeli]